MKLNISILICTFTILAFALPLHAAETASGGRIGYVDFNKALNSVSDGKQAKKRLTDEFREKQQKLDRSRDELKDAKDAIDRDRLLLSPDALSQREAQYGQKLAGFQQKFESFKKEMSVKEMELTGGILSRLKSVVRDIGKEEGFALILEKSQDVVLYAPEGNDLTERVVALYDKGRGKVK